MKQSKEGRRIPGVKKLCQESEHSAKPQFIHGHMFGGLGILAGSIRSMSCVPLNIRLHDGLPERAIMRAVEKIRDDFEELSEEKREFLL